MRLTLKKTQQILVSTLLCAGLSFTFASAQAQNRTIRWAAQNDILTMDPHSENHATTNAVLQHAYEGLTRYNKNYQVEGALATSWQQLSPTQVRFTLRRGVKFHDGSNMTADDVVYSFARIQQPQGTMQIYAVGIKEAVKVDENTVDLILTAPTPVLLRNIIDVRIISKAWAAANKTERVRDPKAKEETFASRNVNGTGPFMIKSWEPDIKIVMSANPNWWDKREGNVTEVIYTPIKADATRVAALNSGDVDLVTDLPTQDVQRLRSNTNLKVLDGPEVRTIFIGLDQFNPELQYSNVKGKNPFKDVRVRKALNLATDSEAMRRTLMRGLSIPANLMVAPGVNGHSAEADKRTPVDADAAKKLLAEAGYPDGFEFTLDCPNNRYVNDEEICQALVSMWAKAGFKVKLNAMAFSNYIPKILKHDTSAYMLGWGVATYDGQYTLQSLVRTKTSGADGNFNLGRVSNPKIDALIDAMKTETNVAKRDGQIREALKMTADEYHYVPIHHQMRPWAMKKNLSTHHKSDDRPEMRYTKFD